MLRLLVGWYSLAFPRSLVYMLQSVEYDVTAYVRWLWRTSDFRSVMYRRQLDRTKPVRLLLLFVHIGIAGQVAIGLLFVVMGMYRGNTTALLSGWIIILLYPFVWAHLIVLPMWLGRRLVLAPRYRRSIARAESTFRDHTASKIAIVGSYGKTSMKELLVSVLGNSLRVAATPANKNVAISHAAFARTLRGDEQVLVIEYGEGAPGDIAAFARNTHPTHAIITGLAPAHLDQYKTFEAAAEDIFSILHYVPPSNVYMNTDSPAIAARTDDAAECYDQTGALGWAVHDVRVHIGGLDYKMINGKQKLHITSQLLGRHNIGPLSLVAALAHEYGMKAKDIELAIQQTKPHEHRMQPYQLGGAWIIDDTYNGNIEGIRAGTQLLAELPARRKIYITPGLVDQGPETQKVHQEMGQLIAAAKPDMVVLMQNSVTKHIQAGLADGAYKGRVKLEPDPLHFYTNLEHFVAAGDIVMMQNDWPDNYR